VHVIENNVHVIDVERISASVLEAAPHRFLDFFEKRPLVITGVDDTSTAETCGGDDGRPGAHWALDALVERFGDTRVLLHAWETEYNASLGHDTRRPLGGRMRFRDWISDYISPRLESDTASSTETGDGACADEDDASFFDEFGFTCDDWRAVELDCHRADEPRYFEGNVVYSGKLALFTRCPCACGVPAWQRSFPELWGMSNATLYFLATNQPNAPPEKDQGKVWLSVLSSLPSLGRVFALLNEGSTGVGSWEEVWRSLRLGGSYKYPTHYDGINNFLCALSPGSGRQVNLWHPMFVRKLNPDTPWAWSIATEEERDGISPRYRARTHSGDCLYIPSYWFHNVSAQGWSASANLYVESPGQVHTFRTSNRELVVNEWNTWMKNRQNV
jgi:hypothetical protein